LDAENLNEELRAEIDALKAEIATLKKNSRNSSKPPSSDIVKPPQPKTNRRY
jgi:cell division protein FtsB